MGKKDQEYIDTLNKLAEVVTAKVATPEYAHFLEIWKALLGGFICKEQSKITPVDDATKALIDQYTPEKIRVLTAGKVVEKIVEKIVEKPAERIILGAAPVSIPPVSIPITPAQINTPPTVPTSNGASGAGGNSTRNFRHKKGVQKIRRKTRELQPEERQIIIGRFNREQTLVDKDNPICTELINVPSYP